MIARARLEFVGVTLALIAASLHVAWGLPRFVLYTQLGRMPDFRPPLFLLSAAVVAAAVVALYRGRAARPVYAILVAIMLVYLGGYVTWHLTGHPILLEGTLRTNLHPSGPVATLFTHLRNDAFALVTVLVELLVIAALAPLLRK